MLKWRLAQWLELKWWKQYLRHKDKHTYLQWKKGYWEKLLGQISPYVKLTQADTVADLGCGPAGIFIALPQNKVTAVDPLIHQYQQHLTTFTPADYPHTTFVESTLENYRPPQPFNAVFCLNAINHVNDIEEAFNSLCRCVKPGGYLVLSIDAHNHQFLKHLFRLIPGDALHPHQYNLAEYTAFIETRGLTVLHTLLLKRETIFSHYVLVAVSR